MKPYGKPPANPYPGLLFCTGEPPTSFRPPIRPMKTVNERALDLASLIGIIWRSAYDSGREDTENDAPITPQQAWETQGFFDENACRLRKGLYDFADDVARVDHLAVHHPNLAVQISRNAISTPPLREAIDREIEDKTALPNA